VIYYIDFKFNFVFKFLFQKARQVFDPSDNNIPKSKLAKRTFLLQSQSPSSQTQRSNKPSKNDLLASPSMSSKSSPEKTPQKDQAYPGGSNSPLSTPSSTPTKFEVGGCVICKKNISNKTQRLVGCKMKNCENQGSF
jgi:hypothetical protein